MAYESLEWAIAGVSGRVEAVYGSLVSRSEDSVTLVCAGPLAAPAASGAAVHVSCGAWAWSGEVKFSAVSGSGDEKRVYHQCRGLYFKLSQYTYMQNRMSQDPDTGTLSMQPTAYVTLFQSSTGLNLSADDQIAEAVAQTGLTLAECSTGLILPQTDECGITVRGVIEKVVEMAPKCAVWFDGDGHLHIAAGAAVDLDNLLSYRIGQRGDLGVRGVVIESYGVASASIEGVERATITRRVQSAGAASGPGVCYIPVQSQGFRRSMTVTPPQKAQVETEDIPADLLESAAIEWWKSHVKDLEGVAGADIEMDSASAVETESGLLLDRSVYPRLALTPVPSNIGKNSVKATFSATVSFSVRDAHGNEIRREIATKISFEGLATDATTRGYTVVPGYVDSTEEDEFIPAGIAASLFAAWNELFGEGEVSFHALHLPDVTVGGKVTVEGVSGYIQSISFDSRTNLCSALIAPPDQSGLQSMVKLQNAMKRITGSPPTSRDIKDSGDPQDGPPIENDITQLVSGGGGGGSTGGTSSLERQDDGSGSPSAVVVRDVADIEGEAELRYRKVQFLGADGESAREAYFLASEPGDPAEEEDDPCADHPEGGDGVDADDGGGVTADGGDTDYNGGVAAGGADGDSGTPGCAAQCEI